MSLAAPQLQGLSQSLTPPQQGQCLNTCCRQHGREEKGIFFLTHGTGPTSFGLSNFTFNTLTRAHSLTVTVPWGCTYRNRDFYQRHLQKLQNTANLEMWTFLKGLENACLLDPHAGQNSRLGNVGAFNRGCREVGWAHGQSHGCEDCAMHQGRAQLLYLESHRGVKMCCCLSSPQCTLQQP